MVRFGRYAAAAALSGLLAVLGTACDEEPTPNIPSTSPSPSESSPSTSPTPEAESAEEFIERWNDSSTEMQNSGDTAEYRQFTSHCEPCTRLAETVEAYYGEGGYIETDGRTIQDVRRAGGKGDFLAFEVDMTSQPTVYQESADGETKTLPGGDSTYKVEVKRLNGEWEMWHYVRLEQ